MCWPLVAKVYDREGMSQISDMIIIILIAKNYYQNGRIRDRYADPDSDRFVAGGQSSTVL